MKDEGQDHDLVMEFARKRVGLMGNVEYERRILMMGFSTTLVLSSRRFPSVPVECVGECVLNESWTG